MPFTEQIRKHYTLYCTGVLHKCKLIQIYRRKWTIHEDTALSKYGYMNSNNDKRIFTMVHGLGDIVDHDHPVTLSLDDVAGNFMATLFWPF